MHNTIMWIAKLSLGDKITLLFGLSLIILLAAGITGEAIKYCNDRKRPIKKKPSCASDDTCLGSAVSGMIANDVNPVIAGVVTSGVTASQENHSKSDK